MCRIAGIFNPGAENLEGDILRMRDAMHRGGPDDAGIFLHPKLPLAFGHRRLSLLDLSSAGHQPMSTPDQNLQLIFNGEIYNFKEIRHTLEQEGYTFKTSSDTEVILYSYHKWGKDCFSRFNGMFALAIWDEQQQELVLARDHAAIKPLYYYCDGKTLIFSSEIRGFKALRSWETEEVWKPLFLMFGHIPEPFTTIRGVRMLNKGEWISFRLPSMEIRQKLFFAEDFTEKVFNHESAIALIRDLLPKAVERHLVSDAPIGLFLSGGIDSSLLTLLAAPVLKERLQTLSIQFEETEFSEEAFQKIIIDITQAKHRAYQVGRHQFESQLDDILNAMDQPSIDAVNTYFISMYAKECGLKAVLSGLGADELFGGYPSFSRFNRWKYLQYLPKTVAKIAAKSSNNKISKLSFDRYHPMLSLYLVNRGLFTTEKAAMISGMSVSEIDNALSEVSLPQHVDYSNASCASAMELNMYMKNQLLKDADYMGMWHSVEIRIPFLDKELMQVVSGISSNLKFSGSFPKSLLIEAFSTLLPAEIWCRRKQGFTFPFAQWLKTSADLGPQSAPEQEIFNGFCAGKLHWSRYWAVKIAGISKFN